MMTRLITIFYLFLPALALAKGAGLTGANQGPEKLAKVLDAKHNFIMKCFSDYRPPDKKTPKGAVRSFTLAVNTDERSYLSIKSMEPETKAITFNNCLRRVLEKEQVKLGYYGKWHYYRYVVSDTGFTRTYSEKANDTGLKTEEITDVIRKNLAPIRECYEQHLQRKPDDQGKMSMRWVVDATGTPTQIEVLSSDLDPSLQPCIVDKVQKMRFPKPRGGEPVTISYPFVFRSE